MNRPSDAAWRARATAFSAASAEITGVGLIDAYVRSSASVHKERVVPIMLLDSYWFRCSQWSRFPTNPGPGGPDLLLAARGRQSLAMQTSIDRPGNVPLTIPGALGKGKKGGRICWIGGPVVFQIPLTSPEFVVCLDYQLGARPARDFNVLGSFKFECSGRLGELTLWNRRLRPGI